MSTFATTGYLGVPDANSTSVGGGTSVLGIRILADFSDIYTSATWYALPLLSKVDLNFAELGGNSNVQVVLMQNKTLNIDNPNAALSDETLEIAITTFESKGDVQKFVDDHKGEKHFIGVPIRMSDTYKLVLWCYGYWKRGGNKSITGNAANSNELIFVAQKHGLATGDITFPVLPVNTDAALDGSDYANEYLGWILPVADVAKGGFGFAVTEPDFGDLGTNDLYALLEYDS